LIEINTLLTELEDLLDRSANEAGISQSERDANQLQIDSIIESIDRFANTTEFQGKRLLSGELDYNTSIQTSDLNKFADLSINAARVPEGGSRDVVVEVTASAQVASVTFGSAATTGTVTIEIAGNLGTEVLTFASGTTAAEITSAINASRELTGVSAIASATGVTINSTSFGTSQYVDVNILADTGNFTANLSSGSEGLGHDTGRDASVTINGNAAITDGLQASVRSQTLSLDIELDKTFNTLDSANFSILGGGADFAIAPQLTGAGQISLGIQSVTTGNLGTQSVGFLNSLKTGSANSLASSNFSTAQRILRSAQEQVSFLRGRLGAFQKSTLDTTANALTITLENTTAAESTIRDTDFASETAALTRSQILTQSATNTLRIANSNPQNVLALLG
jgi:flagellin